MDITISPRELIGAVSAIPSKSQAHRLLICAAFSDAPTELLCQESNRDIDATISCLQALGSKIIRTQKGFLITPIREVPKKATLPCGESGSTLRFLLPVTGALGVDAVFLLEGRLPQRPLSPLWEEMERMGCRLSRPSSDTLCCTGKLRPGAYCIAGNISSQFITGLLFALSLISGKTSLEITGKTESRPYLDMTRQAMELFSAPNYHSPGQVQVEGDWSSAAFFLAAKALGNPVTVTGLNAQSLQGDRAVSSLLPRLSRFTVIDAADIPDLVPVLAVVAGAKAGAEFRHISRLRLKESDRVEAVVSMIHSLGGRASAEDDSLTVEAGGFRGGVVDSRNDHRIAMAAAIAASVSAGPVTITDAQCVQKSYPRFWEEYQHLGGAL